MISYETQGFKNGQVLTAECLNRMEAGIKGACDAAPPTCDATDCSKVLSHGVSGCEWVDLPKGADGKSAYEYAKEAGYPGTEAEFAEKLAQGAYVISLVEDGNELRVNENFYELVRKYENGVPLYMDIMGTILPFSMYTPDEGMVFGCVIEGTNVLAAVSPDGTVIFGELELALRTDIPTKTSQLENDSGFLTSAPVTSVNGKTGAVTIDIPTVPTALKNPNALTINGTSYDGSAAVDVTAKINALIDSKLGVIENGSY